MSPRIETALNQLNTLLVPGETVEAIALQHRLFALTHRRLIVAATSSRLIGMKRGLISGFQLLDMQWQDLQDAEVLVGIIGAKLTINVSTSLVGDAQAPQRASGTLAFDGLQKEAAQRVYQICQTQEQVWREKRRVRELEEMRARAGGVHIGAGGAVPSELRGASLGGEEDSVARLERAKAMLEKGLISDAEFETIKAKIINSL